MKHIIFYSGGIGSWMTAKRVIEKEGVDNVELLFTDTLIEDDDLYRFLLETTQNLFNVDCTSLIERTRNIPATSHETMAERREYLLQLAKDTSEHVKQLHWVADGRDPWQVFKDVRWIGNSRIAQCSHKLKQEAAEKWLVDTYTHEEAILYLGIDWTEEHRTAAPKRNWHPYEVRFPMCNEPFVTKDEMLEELNLIGIETPKLYKLGFSHNNCGSFCVRAGQGHFINLLKTNPELYKYHEGKEQEMREYLDKDASILRRVRKGVKYNLTLKQLREEYEADNTEQIDMMDIGGCGCFVVDAEE